MNMMEKMYNPVCSLQLYFCIGGIGQRCCPGNKQVYRVLEAFLSFDKFSELTMLFSPTTSRFTS